MKLNEIYSNEFINKLNALNQDADLNPEEEVHGFIDVEQILKDLKFIVIHEKNMNSSGRIDENKIYVDESEIKSRQRFSMAHELGHAMKNNRHANRNDDPNDYDDTEKQGEIFANTFAAQFLMPSKLVVMAIDESIKNNGYDRNRLDDNQINELIKEAANKLQVSDGAMKYRIQNLKIFIPAGENQ